MHPYAGVIFIKSALRSFQVPFLYIHSGNGFCSISLVLSYNNKSRKQKAFYVMVDQNRRSYIAVWSVPERIARSVSLPL